MSRVINLNDNRKERTQLTRSVVLALRELAKQSEIDDRTRDLASYIVLALLAIMKTVDQSVLAWEKRGYWLKADRYRYEWIWTETLAGKLRLAIENEDWQNVALLSAQVSEKMQNTKLPQRHRLGTPWVGAWKMLLEAD